MHIVMRTTSHGLIDYWGGIFSEDLMNFKDSEDRSHPRWSRSSVPTIAFHGTDDTTVSPATGEVLCGNLTALGVACELVPLPGQKHGCWGARVTLPGTWCIYIYIHVYIISYAYSSTHAQQR